VLHKVVGYKKVIAERYNTKELDPSRNFNPNIRMFLLRVKDDNVDELMRLSTQVNDDDKRSAQVVTRTEADGTAPDAEIPDVDNSGQGLRRQG
jgi:hypothetical protein